MIGNHQLKKKKKKHSSRIGSSDHEESPGVLSISSGTSERLVNEFINKIDNLTSLKNIFSKQVRTLQVLFIALPFCPCIREICKVTLSLRPPFTPYPLFQPRTLLSAKRIFYMKSSLKLSTIICFLHFVDICIALKKSMMVIHIDAIAPVFSDSLEVDQMLYKRIKVQENIRGSVIMQSLALFRDLRYG